MFPYFKLRPAGKSGNAGGRPRKKEPEDLLTPEDFAMVIVRVANCKTSVRIDGRPKVVSAFEANTIGMASGEVKARLGRKAFIEMVKNAAYTLERARKRIR